MEFSMSPLSSPVPQPKIVTLRSRDGYTYKVPAPVACQSVLVRSMIEVGCTGNFIPLPHVKSDILEKVIQYCKHHADHNDDGDKDPAVLKEFDDNFINCVDQRGLFGLLWAANYMDIPSLLDLACRTVAAAMIKGKTAEQIRQTLNIKNDFTPEEEAQVLQETSWAV